MFNHIIIIFYYSGMIMIILCAVMCSPHAPPLFFVIRSTNIIPPANVFFGMVALQGDEPRRVFEDHPARHGRGVRPRSPSAGDRVYFLCSVTASFVTWLEHGKSSVN